MPEIYKISLKENLTSEQIVETFQNYEEKMKKSGELADWEFETFAFPYNVEYKENKVLLKGIVERYEEILFHINNKELHIQLTSASTCGDKNKAILFSKLLAKKFHASLTFPNNRTMSFE